MENENILTKTNLWKRIFANLIDYSLMFGIYVCDLYLFGGRHWKRI